jgi:hypothetical protein
MTRCLVILAMLLQLGNLLAVDKFALPASQQGACNVPMSVIGKTGDATISKNNTVIRNEHTSAIPASLVTFFISIRILRIFLSTTI